MFIPRKDLELLQKKLHGLETQAQQLGDTLRQMRSKGAMMKHKVVEHSVVEDYPDGLGFDRCLQLTAKWEGGWSNHPEDPGGATNFGITESTYRHAVRDGVIEPVSGGVRRLSRREARDIYREYYWVAPGLKDYSLPAGVDLVVFDAAVNQGPARAVRFLQQAVNDMRPASAALAVDGVLGPRTQEAVRAACTKGGRVGLLQHFTVRRMLHWSSLSHMASFGLGWFRRGIDVLVTAIDPKAEWKKP